MSSASVRFGTKAYVCARYFLRPGKCFKYIDQRGDDVTEHIYEVMALYPYCVLLRDTKNGVRTCPGYCQATREKDTIISPSQYGAFLQKRGKRRWVNQY